jgi:hypothetical protein
MLPFFHEKLNVFPRYFRLLRHSCMYCLKVPWIHKFVYFTFLGRAILNLNQQTQEVTYFPIFILTSSFVLTLEI